MSTLIIAVYCGESSKIFDFSLSLAYSFEIIYSKQETAKNIWDAEILLKRKIRKSPYIPHIQFNGSKEECFKILI